jgi:predicted ABC-type sugar transport system permease subunit
VNSSSQAALALTLSLLLLLLLLLLVLITVSDFIKLLICLSVINSGLYRSAVLTAVVAARLACSWCSRHKCTGVPWLNVHLQHMQPSNNATTTNLINQSDSTL